MIADRAASGLEAMISRRLLVRVAERHGSRVMLSGQDGQRTYAEVAVQISARSCRMREAGVAGHVIVALPSSDELLYSVFALLEAGAIPVLTNPALTPRERNAIRDDCQAAWIVEPSVSGAELRRLESAGPARGEPPDPEEEAADAVMFYTSGSTGRMKGVVHTLGSLLRNPCQVARALGVTSADRYFTSVPLFHLFGFAPGMLTAVLNGATLIAPQNVGALGLLEQVQRQSATVLLCGASLLRQLVMVARADRPDLSCLRCVLVSGAVLPRNIAEAAMETLCPRVLNLYGTTETGIITMTTGAGEPERLATTAGRALPGVEVKIVGDDRQSVPFGTVGEVACRTAGRCREYLNLPEETSRVRDAEGWHYTGDLGCLDEAGYLTLAGRKDDMIIKLGFNVYPKEVDLVLSSHPGVADCVVVGVADERRGERIRAAVIPVPGSALSEHALQAFCAERLVYYKVPEEILVVDAFPRTPTGKVDLKSIRSPNWSSAPRRAPP